MVLPNDSKLRYEEEVMKDRLRECPKCRSAVEYEYMDWIQETCDGDDGTGWIICECGIKSPRMTRDDAIEWWNTRVTDPLMEKMAKVLEEIVRCMYKNKYSSYTLTDDFDSSILIKVLQEYQERKDAK